MVSMEDIRKIYLMEGLTDEMLEKLCPIVEKRQYKEREVIYREGDKAEYFYMLKRGKILLEVEVSAMIIISLGSIKSGYSFGWSSLIPGSTHTSYAICSDPCEILYTPGEQFLALLREDHTMGFIIMESIMKILKGRLDRRTGQFLKVMKKHPDIQKLLGL
ncbi:MAG: cyclic nucleotide-binding domain-containing protein [Deltaproteobacteria bacterium]|nr:cyclic nucleotide-binding domain-containing protein [Deltaproteobacteria bacterium]